jgi:hypothetical protein
MEQVLVYRILYWLILLPSSLIMLFALGKCGGFVAKRIGALLARPKIESIDFAPSFYTHGRQATYSITSPRLRKSVPGSFR